MRDKVRNAVLGAIAGHTLGSPLNGKSTFTKLAFYEPVPPRMVPSHNFDAWLVFAGLDRDASFDKVQKQVQDVQRPDEGSGQFAANNVARGLFLPASGHFANPLRRSGGSLTRAVYWGLVFDADPVSAGRCASLDASSDHSEDGVWCAAAVAQAIAVAEQGTTVAQIIRAVSAGLPPQSLLSKGIGQVLQAMGQADGAKLVQANLQSALSNADQFDAARTLTHALAGLAFAKDFASCVTAAAGCGGASSDAAAISGALAAIVFGGVPEDWLRPLGSNYVSCSLSPNFGDVPDTIEAFIEKVASKVPSEPVPELPASENVAASSEPESQQSTVTETETQADTVVNEDHPVTDITEPAIPEPEPVAPDPPQPQLPPIPVGNTLCKLVNGIQFEIQYVTGPTCHRSGSVQLGVTVKNLSQETVERTFGVNAPPEWSVAAKQGQYQIKPGEQLTQGIVVQPGEQLTQDSRLSVSFGEDTVVVPVLRPLIWFSAGPFSNEDSTAYDKETPPERSQIRTAYFSGRSGMSLRWERREMDQNQMDVEPLFSSGPGVVVLFSRLKFPKPGKITIVASCSPGVVVKVDGQTVVKYKDSHVPSRRSIAPYAGTFETAEWTGLTVKLIRDLSPVPELVLYFMDELGNVVVPESAPDLLE